MTDLWRKRLILLGTTSVFAVALATAPIQLSFVSGTLDEAVAHAGNHAGSGGGPGAATPSGNGNGGRGGTSGAGGHSSTTAGGGSDTTSSSGKE